MITFFSNYINDHQIPLCNALYEVTNHDFYFIGTHAMSEERKKLGYIDKSNKLPYVINTYDDEKNVLIAKELGRSSDIVIIGEAPDEYIQERIREGKITFRYSERYFKEGYYRIIDPRVFISHFKRDFINRDKKLYMLCASAYTAKDCRFIFSYPNKTFRWGYFPEVRRYENPLELIKGKNKSDILWVGRFMKLKHPEYVIFMANELRRNGYQFSINMIGIGDLKEYIESLIHKESLENYIHILGAKSSFEVREYMEKSGIFLFTSDKREGWGAVLNEAMNSCCAVVANSEIGSVPFLIRDSENGMVYDGSVKSLTQKVASLLNSPDKQVRMGKQAYETILTEWNAEEAARRFLLLAKGIIGGVSPKFETGPCSKC